MIRSRISYIKDALPVVALKATDGKEVRAETVLSLFEARKVKFPANAPWLDDVMREFMRFPNGKNDDAVDSIVWALIQLQEIALRLQWSAMPDSMEAQLQRMGSWLTR